jgi:TRAP-type C4-dicarboxylate transport system permease small subunit
MARLWRWVELGLETVISLCLAAMAVVTVIDVAGRYLFNAPLKGGYEISEMMMALTVFAALPLATRADSHLTVGLLTDRLHGWPRRIHRVVILAISAAALAFIAWRMGIQADILTRSGGASGSLQLPLWPLARVMSWLGWFSCAVALVLLARAALGLDRDAQTGRRIVE